MILVYLLNPALLYRIGSVHHSCSPFDALNSAALWPLFKRVITPVAQNWQQSLNLLTCVEKPMKWIISSCFLILLYGCSNLPEVKPWQKGNLAKEEMTFGSDGFDDAFDDHIYFSKEASSGGRGLGGGGCGCN